MLFKLTSKWTIRRVECTIHTPYAFDKKTQHFAQGLNVLRFWSRFETLDSRLFQVAIYTVFHKEFESEVEFRDRREKQ